MFKAKNNLGIYHELYMTLDYIEDDNDLLILDQLLKDFVGKGLTGEGIRIAIELIEDYLPNYIECDSMGCYFTQIVDDIPALTYFSDIETDEQLVPVSIKTLVYA